MQVKQIHSISQIDGADWNRLTGLAYPFLRHEFLLALEQSASVCEKTGWLPRHLLVTKNEELLALMPFYLKMHSWGEYVFDQQWAQAYRQQGIAYYPKWLTAIPLTPCQGSRVVVKNDADRFEITQLLLAYIKKLSEECGISSWHCLFPDEKQADLFRTLGLTVRQGVQFQWFNRGYRNFNDFLQSLNAGKRKMLKRERRRTAEQGIRLMRISGVEVSDAQWQIFFKFYAMTYLKRQSQPYLNLAFFRQIAASMGEQVLLVLAIKEQDYIGAALSFVGEDCLYGRYWGCYEEYNALHFEACYYQGLEYCIEQGLVRFDSGAQGEHKISRGFEPVTTYSIHWLKDAGFAKAVEHFVAGEQKILQSYKQEASAFLPYRMGI